MVPLMGYLSAGLKYIVPGIILSVGAYILLSNTSWKDKEMSFSEKLKLPLALGYFLSLEMLVLISRGSMGRAL